MGRVRTKTVKKASRVIIEKYYQRLTLDFDTNKRICEEVAIIQSKRLRNKIAGFTTHLMKRIQRGPVRGISLKLQVGAELQGRRALRGCPWLVFAAGPPALLLLCCCSRRCCFCPACSPHLAGEQRQLRGAAAEATGGAATRPAQLRAAWLRGIGRRFRQHCGPAAWRHQTRQTQRVQQHGAVKLGVASSASCCSSCWQHSPWQMDWKLSQQQQSVPAGPALVLQATSRNIAAQPGRRRGQARCQPSAEAYLSCAGSCGPWPVAGKAANSGMTSMLLLDAAYQLQRIQKNCSAPATVGPQQPIAAGAAGAPGALASAAPLGPRGTPRPNPDPWLGVTSLADVPCCVPPLSPGPLQEEERERRMDFIPDESAINTDAIEVDKDTMEMLRSMNMAGLPGVTVAQVGRSDFQKPGFQQRPPRQ